MINYGKVEIINSFFTNFCNIKFEYEFSRSTAIAEGWCKEENAPSFKEAVMTLLLDEIFDCNEKIKRKHL